MIFDFWLNGHRRQISLFYDGGPETWGALLKRLKREFQLEMDVHHARMSMNHDGGDGFAVGLTSRLLIVQREFGLRVWDGTLDDNGSIDWSTTPKYDFLVFQHESPSTIPLDTIRCGCIVM
jgi:hypothetical protein